MSDTLPYDMSFEQHAKEAELQIKLVEVLSEARLKEAKSGSIDAHTLEQMLTNRCKAKSIREYEIALQRFHSQRFKRELEIAQMRVQAHNLSQYQLGHRTTGLAWQNVWAAYKVMLTKSPDIVLSWMTTPSEVKAASSDWVYRSISGTPYLLPVDIKDSDISTQALLLDWQLEHYTKAVVRFGTPAHAASIRALSRLSEAAKPAVEALEKAIADIEKGTYDLWKPQELVKITDAPIS